MQINFNREVNLIMPINTRYILRQNIIKFNTLDVFKLHKIEQTIFWKFLIQKNKRNSFVYR